MTDTEARQQNALDETWSQIRVYLLLTVAISAVFCIASFTPDGWAPDEVSTSPA